jgi:transcriptional regulator with XRE-family HTH domain
MGVGLNSLGQYETGRREIPLSTAQKMATLYGVTLEKIAEAANQK